MEALMFAHERQLAYEDDQESQDARLQQTSRAIAQSAVCMRDSDDAMRLWWYHPNPLSRISAAFSEEDLWDESDGSPTRT